MKNAIQRDLFDGKREYGPRRTKHGGGLESKKRKIARPFQSNKPIHIVMKSSLAKGKMSLLSMQNRILIEQIIKTHASKVKAKIHASQNVGSHIHLLMTFKTKTALTNFLKTITALISRHVTKAKKGKPFGKRFWDERPFTRIVKGLRDFRGMLNYILKNKIEAEFGSDARTAIEKLERAQAKARRSGRCVSECL